MFSTIFAIQKEKKSYKLGCIAHSSKQPCLLELSTWVCCIFFWLKYLKDPSGPAKKYVVFSHQQILYFGIVEHTIFLAEVRTPLKTLHQAIVRVEKFPIVFLQPIFQHSVPAADCRLKRKRCLLDCQLFCNVYIRLKANFFLTQTVIYVVFITQQAASTCK